MSGAISDSVLVRVLSSDQVEPLSPSGIEQLWLAVAAWNQATEGSLQLWADSDVRGNFLRMDMFDDLYDLGDVVALNREFTEFFNALSRRGWLVLSLIDGNLAVDIDFEIPSSLKEPEVRHRIIACLSASEANSPLHEAMKVYATESLDF